MTTKKTPIAKAMESAPKSTEVAYGIDFAPLGAAVAKAREDAAIALGGSYGAQREYAKALNAAFGEFAWYEVGHKDFNMDDANHVALKKEKDAFMAALKKINHSNPSAAYKQIRDYARAEATGNGQAQNDAGNATRTARPLDSRVPEELIKLYRAIKSAEKASDPVKHAGVAIGEILEKQFKRDLAQIIA